MGAAGHRVRKPPSPARTLDELTPQQRSVLALVACSCSNKQIARHLGIADETVKNHMTLILRRLGVQDRVQAALWYLGQFVTDVSDGIAAGRASGVPFLDGVRQWRPPRAADYSDGIAARQAAGAPWLDERMSTEPRGADPRRARTRRRAA